MNQPQPIQNQPSWPSALVAIAIIALVGYMFKLAVDHDFATIWAGVGTIVGVVTGAIPAYFFRQQTQQAQQQTQQAQQQVADANEEAKLYAAAADPARVTELVNAMRR